MKRLLVVALSAIMCAALVVPVSALENEFGGYWRTRAYMTNNWDGQDSGTSAVVDTRTRLYYTAKFTDDFKFVNKFEFNNVWGSPNGGDIGTDGKSIFRIKHSYADFNTAGMNMKIGMQAAAIGRSIMFDDDFAGLTATKKAGNNAFTFRWMKIDEENDTWGTGSTGGEFPDMNNKTSIERDYYNVVANLNLSDTMTVSPYLVIDKQEGDEATEAYYLGADIDMKMDTTSLWASVIYAGGEKSSIEAGRPAGGKAVDMAAYFLALGADAGLVHGQLIYASGQDPKDGDLTAFTPTEGAAYYWAEILGLGIFDNDDTSGLFDTAPNGKLSNLMALNVGTTLKPMDKLTLSFDLWYAQLVEDATFVTASGVSKKESDLGIELDINARYQLLDNMSLDLVCAYLMAGDAAANIGGPTNGEDVLEAGMRLSFSF